MLVIISDLHLGDGTTATSIPASAFHHQVCSAPQIRCGSSTNTRPTWARNPTVRV